MEGAWGNMGEYHGRDFSYEFEGRESRGMFDHMALPDHFLEQYYTEKLSRGMDNHGAKESLLVYDYEGQGSPAGSVGCCSSLGADNDLQFLNDLGPKFKTLAEVCGGKKISTEVKPVITPLSSASIHTEIKPVIPPMPSATINTHTTVSSVVSNQQLPPPPKPEPAVSQREHTVVKETSERSQRVKESTATVREGMNRVNRVNEGATNQGQVLMLQQQPPVYYTTTPMMQPVHYVVQPQVPNTVLLAEAPPTNLQGMVLVNGTQTVPTQGLVVQGQTMMATGQVPGPGMVLVDNSQVQGATTNLVHAGSHSMLVVDGAAPSGSKQMLAGSQTCLVQGATLQPGGLSGYQRGLSGSQRVLVVEGSPRLTRDISGSNRLIHSKSSTSLSSGTVNTPPNFRRVVVQETKEMTK